MVRTVISLDAAEKRWLDRKARAEGVPMTEIVRLAIRRFRETSEEDQPSLEDVLQETKGLWAKGDGLAYQRKVRDEWDRAR
jgi:hypothetical protein